MTERERYDDMISDYQWNTDWHDKVYLLPSFEEWKKY